MLNEDGSSKNFGERKPGIGIQAAVIGSVSNHPFLKDAMEWYNKNHFILCDGSYNNVFIAPDVLAMCAEKYGFKYKNEEQKLKEGMLILPSNIIAGDYRFDINDSNIALHLTLNSWNPRKKTLLHKVTKFLRKFL